MANTPKHVWEVPKADQRKFRGAYKRGWNYSDNVSDPNHQGLDGNPDTGALYWAWEDGYMDRATDREYGHRLVEHEHGEDEQACAAIDDKLYADWKKTQK